MSRKMIPALVAGLLLTTAALPGPAPAAMPMGVYTPVGVALLRIDSVSVDSYGRHTLKVMVVNEGAKPVTAAQLVQVRAHAPGRLMQGSLLAPRLEDGAAAGETVLKPHDRATLYYALPDDPALPMLTVRALDPEGSLREAFSSSIEDLQASVAPALNTEQLGAFAGRYRTSLGTVVTFIPFDGGLSGTSVTVGGGRQDYGHSWSVTPLDKWNLSARLKSPRGEAFGEATLSAHTNKPLSGNLKGGPQAGQAVSLCPISESEPNAWSDAGLRAGSIAWGRLEGATATRLDDGRLRIEARLTVWNVSAGPAAVQIAVARGYEVKGVMWRAEVGAGGADPGLMACQGKTLNLVAEGRFDDVDSLLLQGGLNGRTYADPWNISAVIAKAPPQPKPPEPAPGPSPEPDPSEAEAADTASRPAPVPAPPASRGTGGASRPSREGSGDGVPAALRSYSNYGIWDFRVEELGPGPDGEWQAVVRVRDAAIYRVGLSTGGVKLWLFDEDGRSLENNDVLYRASVTGAANQLEGIPQTMWMEKGDEIRVRLLVRGSKGFKPVRLRLGSGDRETLSRTWPMP